MENHMASDVFCSRPTFPLTDQSLPPAVGGRPSSTPTPNRPPPWGFVRLGWMVRGEPVPGVLWGKRAEEARGMHVLGR